MSIAAMWMELTRRGWEMEAELSVRRDLHVHHIMPDKLIGGQTQLAYHSTLCISE